MVDQVGALGHVANLLGLKRSAKQEQLAADLAREAQEIQRDYAEEARTINEVDPDQPARRGQIIDIIA